MHSTDVKPDSVSQHQQQQQQQQQLPHHGQTSGSPGRRMTNGDGVVVAGGSRHHRDVSAPNMVISTNECAGCGKRITDRFLLKALDMFWHEDCLKCGCCDCRLGEVGSTLYTKANLILCKRDYLRLFGSTGYCAACSKVIPAFEMVMRARNNVYHLECFACQQCNHRFCVGDRFYLCENKILCEYDYEERMVFASMTCSQGSLALLRRQVSNFQPRLQSEQHEQQQQQQQSEQQQPFSSSTSIFSIVDQYDQLDQQQPKHSLPLSKTSVSESLNVGSYGEPHHSPFALSLSPSSPPPPPSSQHCSQTSYITKQARVREHGDPFVSESNASLTSPPTKRPKSSSSSSYSSFNNNDNLGASSLIRNLERNNNSYEKLTIGKPLLSFPTPVITPIQSLHCMPPEDQPNFTNASKGNPTIGNNAMGSPDSGIVEGP